MRKLKTGRLGPDDALDPGNVVRNPRVDSWSDDAMFAEGKYPYLAVHAVRVCEFQLQGSTR